MLGQIVVIEIYTKIYCSVLHIPKDLTLYQAFDGYLDGYWPGLGSELIL